jgi:hypothetical protein
LQPATQDCTLDAAWEWRFLVPNGVNKAGTVIRQKPPSHPILMKKLVSLFCCVLCLHSFSAPPTTAVNKAAGEKVLVKALAVIINRENQKKAPAKVSSVVLPRCA